jgi:rhamnulokinase
MGNLLTQVRAAGELASLAEMRDVVRNSGGVKRYEPRSAVAWQDAAARFDQLSRQCADF